MLPSSSTMLLALCILLLLHISCAQDPISPFYLQKPLPCGRTCKFKLCRFGQRMMIGAPNLAQHATICRLGEDLQDILEVGEAPIVKAGMLPVPISQWRLLGLDIPFKKHFFGVGHRQGQENPTMFTRKVRGNQYNVLHGACAVLPIQKYTVLKGNATRTKLGKEKSECLSFLIRTSEIIVELEWFSGDDLDLSIREPDGTIVGFRNLRSRCGKLQLDNCVDCCGLFEVARERVLYDRGCDGFQC